MKRFKYAIWVIVLAIACFSIIYTLSSRATYETGKACSITCYEKTPTCYVTAEGNNCLTISNEKPSCDTKGSCVCKIAGCDTKTTYLPDGKTESTTKTKGSSTTQTTPGTN